MTLNANRPTVTKFGVLGLVAAAIAGGMFAMPNSETALRSSFEVALKETSLNAVRVGSAAPVSGSEAFWLDAARNDAAGPMMKTVAIGDEIAFSVGGERRTYQVQTVAEYLPHLTAIDTAEGHPRMVLVTARDTKTPGERVIRFVIELETPTPSKTLVQGQAGRTL